MDKCGIKVLFKFEVDGNNDIFYEESIRLLKCNFEDVFEEAEKLFAKDYREYVNPLGQRVVYSYYMGVEGFLIYDDIEFEDGAEVFSTIFKLPSDKFPLTERYDYCDKEDMFILRDAELNFLKGK